MTTLRHTLEHGLDVPKDRKARKRHRRDTAFLPAALEIMETPPHPLGRAISLLIIAAAATALAWAALSPIDIVATAEGRVIPRGKLQSVEAAEIGSVRELFVTEGQHVAIGDPLLALDPTDADADAAAARSELAAAERQLSRAEALLGFAQSRATPALVDIAATERALISARIAEHRAELASLSQRETGARFAADQADTEIARIDALLPMIEQRYDALAELAERGYASRLRVQELKEDVTSLIFERQTRLDEQAKAAAEIAMLQRDQAARREAFRRLAAEEMAEAETIIATRRELLLKAERREQLQTLTAPVSGTINDIAITTIGEVVQAGQPLITLVPEGDELIIEAFLQNQDVGFIQIGDPVVIKLAAYPFTRYGHLEGEVEHIFADSTVDERQGLIYPARIRITGSAIRLNALAEASGARPDSYHDLLQAGLSATIEVKTGQRSVLSFLLSPIARATSEAGRER